MSDKSNGSVRDKNNVKKSEKSNSSVKLRTVS